MCLLWLGCTPLCRHLQPEVTRCLPCCRVQGKASKPLIPDKVLGEGQVCKQCQHRCMLLVSAPFLLASCAA